MPFNSFVFLIFFVITVTLYYLVPKRITKFFLLSANFLFYSYFDYRFSLILLGLAAFSYIFYSLMTTTPGIKQRKIFLISGITINLIALGFFKYFNFFIESFSFLFESVGFQLNQVSLNIILPIGISFYVFQSISLLIDTFMDDEAPKYSFISVLLYLSFFPTVLAGPIERAYRLIPQINKIPLFNKENLNTGLMLISIGYFRKVFIGDAAGKISDQIFATPQYYVSVELIFGLLLFTIQIYNDFAGYSLIARGSAKLLGIEISDNFNQPYLSRSIAEFWRRWHISLSTWLKDYVFTPMQLLLRHRKFGTVVALLITFTLCGLWHGPSWNFIFWGALQGIFISSSLLTQSYRENFYKKFRWQSSKVLNIWKSLITFLLILFSWLIFKSENFDGLLYTLQKIFEFEPSQYMIRFFTITITYYIISFTLDFLETSTKSKTSYFYKIGIAYRFGIVSGFWIVLLLYLFQDTSSPFIYFKF